MSFHEDKGILNDVQTTSSSKKFPNWSPGSTLHGYLGENLASLAKTLVRGSTRAVMIISITKNAFSSKIISKTMMKHRGKAVLRNT